MTVAGPDEHHGATSEQSAAGLTPSEVALILDAALQDDSKVATVRELLADGRFSRDDVDQLHRSLRRARTDADRLRRRSDELSALFSTARELVRIRDVDDLLDRLVERAHDLVGTDVTYLSEFDKNSRELVVRTTRGTVAETFRHLRVPAGMGLASQVVQTRNAQWTANYAAMTQVPHDTGIDHAVHDEGLVSLLGVPLLSGNIVLGVLFAANRAEHRFTPDEVSLLSAFADHAAVVLQTARLLGQSRTAEERSKRAYAELADHVESMERASSVHENLTGVVLRGGSAQQVSDTLAAALRRPVMIVDSEMRTVATDLDGLDDADAAIDAVRGALQKSRTSGRCVFVAPTTGAVKAVVAVVAGQSSLGAILIGPGDLQLGPVEQRTVERAAQITALLTLKQNALLDAEERVRGELVGDILSANPARRRGLELRVRAREVELADLSSVAIAHVKPDDRAAAVRALTRTLGDRAFAAEDSHGIAVVGSERDVLALAHEVHRELRSLSKNVTVVAGPVTHADGLPASADEARRCLDLIPHLDIEDGVVRSVTLAPYTAMFGDDPGKVRAFITHALGPVIAWDRSRGSELVLTLEAYLRLASNVASTARTLHVHKNTVLQRLDRVTALLGDRWQEAEPRFQLEVAVRMYSLGQRYEHPKAGATHTQVDGSPTC